ncbi:hypothetical protein ACWA5Z_02740 [Testudinibacter sp. P80/BLE/0925]
METTTATEKHQSAVVVFIYSDGTPPIAPLIPLASEANKPG